MARPWVRTPWVGQARRARSARICSRHRPRSRCRHVEATVRRSYRALVVNPHRGQASLRLRSRTVTTTWAGPKPTSVTDTPRRSMRRLDAVVARTGLWSSQFRFVSIASEPKEDHPVSYTHLTLPTKRI